jgi:hypothetical protein
LHSWRTGFHWNPMRQLQESIGIQCWAFGSRTLRLNTHLAIPIIRIRIGAAVSKIPTMSVLYAKRSSPDSKLEFSKVQGHLLFMSTGFIKRNFIFEKSQEIKGLGQCSIPILANFFVRLSLRINKHVCFAAISAMINQRTAVQQSLYNQHIFLLLELCIKHADNICLALRNLCGRCRRANFVYSNRNIHGTGLE